MKARVVQETVFSDDYSKNSIQRTERNTFLKTVFYDDDAQNSGQAKGKISRKN
jgi:hypothetical protein